MLRSKTNLKPEGTNKHHQTNREEKGKISPRVLGQLPSRKTFQTGHCHVRLASNRREDSESIAGEPTDAEVRFGEDQLRK